jgi:hypothetical protein
MLAEEEVWVEQPESARQTPLNSAAMMLFFMGMTTDKGKIRKRGYRERPSPRILVPHLRF